MKKLNDKTALYETLMPQIYAVLEEESNIISMMSTLACLLNEAFDAFFWTGFYIKDGDVLKVGPYQGTLGCLTIEFDRGVCGRAYRTGETQIVEDTHADPAHIACDPNSLSEIVIPVRDRNDEIIAVLDIDSTSLNAFDDTDAFYLEQIIQTVFSSAITI